MSAKIDIPKFDQIHQKCKEFSQGKFLRRFGDGFEFSPQEHSKLLKLESKTGASIKLESHLVIFATLLGWRRANKNEKKLTLQNLTKFTKMQRV